MNFTAAHELGHLILHEQSVLHRDRPFDGGTTADKFADLFLMPRAFVKDVFYEIFGAEKLRMDEAVALALAVGNLGEFRTKYKDLRSFAILIA